ncbi:MAG: 50S ribosomal protein L25/general stress protein Ctc [Nitrosomonadales bacterium]|jgi:large subunit ribosomal protein L25
MKIEIKANVRDTKGTGASRRLRKNGSIPGIVYGNKKDAVSITLDGKDLSLKFKKEAFHASILSLDLDGKKESVLLRDYQLEPVKSTLLHVDFQRINENEKIHVKVPFHFINEDIAKGVKLDGGVITHIITEVDIACLPKDLPQFIEVDLTDLGLGHSIHLSEIKLPEGIELTTLTHGNDAAVTSIVKPKVKEEEPIEAAATAGEEAKEENKEEDKKTSDDNG